jgi:hypothetical protein
MKTRSLLWIVFLGTSLLVLAACGRKAEAAAEYNDKIISRQLSIIKAFELMDSTLRDTSASVDRIDYAYLNLNSKIKEARLALDSIGSFQQDPSFQLSAKELFEAYEMLIEEEYRTLSDIHRIDSELVTEAVADSANAAAQRVLEKTKEIQEKFVKAQDEFGKKYNLIFE